MLKLRAHLVLFLTSLAFSCPANSAPLSYQCIDSTESETIYFYAGDFVGAQALIPALRKKLKRLRKRRSFSERAARRSKRTRKEIRKLRRGLCAKERNGDRPRILGPAEATVTPTNPSFLAFGTDFQEGLQAYILRRVGPGSFKRIPVDHTYLDSENLQVDIGSDFAEGSIDVRLAVVNPGDNPSNLHRITLHFEDDPAPYCGDGIVQPELGEECEGEYSDSTTLSCDLDGYQGSQVFTQGCENCLFFESLSPCESDDYCGDGQVNGPEECDDGNNLNNDGCSQSCQHESSVGEAPTIVPGDGFNGPTPSPEQVGSGPGSDAIAIARWDVVPYQRVSNDFEVGVIAFHINRINRVEISAAGGAWTPIYEMRENPRLRGDYGQPGNQPGTGVVEYWGRLDISDIPDGLIELRAIAYPEVGVPQLLEPMYLNVDRSPPAIRWAAPNGTDSDNCGLTRGSPCRTPARAVTSLGAQAAGGTVYLEPGTYALNPLDAAGPRPDTADYWVTIAGAPDASRDEIILAGSNYNPAERVRFHHLTITTTLTAAIPGIAPGHCPEIWLDDVVQHKEGALRTAPELSELCRNDRRCGVHTTRLVCQYRSHKPQLCRPVLSRLPNRLRRPRHRQQQCRTIHRSQYSLARDSQPRLLGLLFGCQGSSRGNTWKLLTGLRYHSPRFRTPARS